MDKYVLQTERLILRPVSETDLNHVHALHSIPEVQKFNTAGIPADLEETKNKLAEWMTENEKVDCRSFTFTIERKEEQDFIGLIAITLGREKYKNAEVWFKFDPKFWNLGYGTESLQSIIDFGFKTLNLHRIEAGCAIENVGSYKVMEKAGMKREAHTRQLLPLASGWSDNYGYAILETDLLMANG